MNLTTSPDTTTSNTSDEPDDEGGLETKMCLEPRYVIFLFLLFLLY